MATHIHPLIIYPPSNIAIATSSVVGMHHRTMNNTTGTEVTVMEEDAEEKTEAEEAEEGRANKGGNQHHILLYTPCPWWMTKIMYRKPLLEGWIWQGLPLPLHTQEVQINHAKITIPGRN